MKIYLVGYETCEGFNYTYLTHEQSYTKDEFANMIHHCVKLVINTKKTEGPYCVHSYEHVHGGVVELLCLTYGFKRIEADVSWTVFGWASLFKLHDWSSYREEPDELTALTKYLHKHGFTEKDDDSRR